VLALGPIGLGLRLGLVRRVLARIGLADFVLGRRVFRRSSGTLRRRLLVLVRLPAGFVALACVLAGLVLRLAGTLAVLRGLRRFLAACVLGHGLALPGGLVLGFGTLVRRLCVLWALLGPLRVLRLRAVGLGLRR